MKDALAGLMSSAIRNCQSCSGSCNESCLWYTKTQKIIHCVTCVNYRQSGSRASDPHLLLSHQPWTNRPFRRYWISSSSLCYFFGFDQLEPTATGPGDEWLVGWVFKQRDNEFVELKWLSPLVDGDRERSRGNSRSRGMIFPTTPAKLTDCILRHATLALLHAVCYNDTSTASLALALSTQRNLLYIKWI